MIKNCHAAAVILAGTSTLPVMIKQLKNRLSRVSGQINGIIKMLDDNRYCGDILIQVAAVESAMQSFGYLILQEHMKTCMTEEIQSGNTEVVDEVLELMKKLK